ncbi:zinc-dependent metalloprotease [Mycolicibacterium madagascariense]|uniref:zinc-dependent metalloprotease n=1 Tax=Mycolicibacterium madagascariense TaxID=212765 RepID=UPI0013D58FE8|nr:zinc-dependent metalloprotease [Mycolicibacterium madagascariense]MCV7014563.1 zinc-dependent metalloprotease [Mycolicibacterium madagascariense]
MSPASPVTVGRTVDWDFAATVGAKLVRPAPPVTDYTRNQAIEELADAARRAEEPVRDVAGLSEGAEVTEARIVDRVEWVRAATESMRVMTGGTRDGVSGGRIARRVTGAQTGAVLAFVSSGILGQYDPFAAPRGELLLVYPNVIAVERQLRVSPADFRLWVCLHEVTHRVQFRANPWLAEHMSQSLAVVTDDSGQDLTQVVSRLGEFVKARRSANSHAAQSNSEGIVGLLRAVQSEPQRAALDRLLVLGTLLEGHADHVMDAVGPKVVPSVATIRRRFDERRRHRQPPLQRVLRALLGFDAKMSQYTRGKAFVDHVVGAVGTAAFNTVWTSPETLPLPTEVDEPQRWIDRVL